MAARGDEITLSFVPRCAAQLHSGVAFSLFLPFSFCFNQSFHPWFLLGSQTLNAYVSADRESKRICKNDDNFKLMLPFKSGYSPFLNLCTAGRPVCIFVCVSAFIFLFFF